MYHARHSSTMLTSLKCPYPGFDSKRVSLRAFKRLEKLSCTLEALWPNDLGDDIDFREKYGVEEEEIEDEKTEVEVEEGEFRLKDILPYSLERLHIWDRDSDVKHWPKSILQQIDDAKSSLPNLKEVLVTSQWHQSGWYPNATSKLLEGME